MKEEANSAKPDEASSLTAATAPSIDATAEEPVETSTFVLHDVPNVNKCGIASLFLAALGTLCYPQNFFFYSNGYSDFGLNGPLLGLVAIFLGIHSLRQIRNSGDTEVGRELAIAGICMGCLLVLSLSQLLLLLIYG